MRGYRILKESNRLCVITEVKESLTNCPLNPIIAASSNIIFGAGLKSAELIVRQFLLVRIADLSLNKSLLYSLGKPGSALTHPLPPEWRKIIEQHGFKVSNLRSRLAWYGFIIKMLFFGIASIAIRGLQNFVALLGFNDHSMGNYAYFEALAPGNLPQPFEDGRSHDIITWYYQWDGRVTNLETFCHGVKGLAPRVIGGSPVISIKSAIPLLTGLSVIIRYIGWGTSASALAIVDLFRGRWWHILLLRESSKSAQIRFLNPGKLARDYLFHNSGWIYRPLWTYEAEKSGSRILFYFYSTNCESFKLPERYPIQANSWQAMNWPHYLVWDQYQSDFVRRAVGEHPTISIVGPIWFHTSPIVLEEFLSRTVAVFDVQPVRDAFYQTLGIALEYYIPNTANQFLNDIYAALIEIDAILVLKRKRKINRLAHPKYRKLLEDFDGRSNFKTVDPDISAIRVIECCEAVISMPFTSTALLGRELGKPSVYYDPHGMIQKDDRAAHGIEILTGPKELSHWLKTVLIPQL